MEMKVVCVCLARGGSKRLPGKLLKDFGGKHLIEWTLEFMEKIPYDGYVYTDYESIREVVKNYDVNLRDKILENKEGIHKTSEELKEYNKELKADVFILVQGTSPLRDLKKFDYTMTDFLFNGYDVAFTVNEFDKYVYDQDGEILNCENRGFNKKIDNYVENGSIYIFKKEQLDKQHITDGKKLFILDKFDIDIDYTDDLKKANILYNGGYYEN